MGLNGEDQTSLSHAPAPSSPRGLHHTDPRSAANCRAPGIERRAGRRPMAGWPPRPSTRVSTWSASTLTSNACRQEPNSPGLRCDLRHGFSSGGSSSPSQWRRMIPSGAGHPLGAKHPVLTRRHRHGARRSSITVYLPQPLAPALAPSAAPSARRSRSHASSSCPRPSRMPRMPWRISGRGAAWGDSCATAQRRGLVLVADRGSLRTRPPPRGPASGRSPARQGRWQHPHPTPRRPAAPTRRPRCPRARRPTPARGSPAAAPR